MADRPGAPAAADAAAQTGLLAAVQRMSGTRWNYLVGQTADIVVGIALLGAAVVVDRAHPVRSALLVLLGLFIFSFLEYACHRWLFHGPVRLFERGHTLHHQRPLGWDSLPFFVAPLIAFALAAVLALAMPAGDALFLAGAIALGYALYGCAHFVVHRRRFRSALGRDWVRIHNIHHARPDTNYGVTTPLWDMIFGTWCAPRSKPHR